MPLYYDTFSTGRPVPEANPGKGYVKGYIDERNTALYPFGWGLSYTQFS